jgi:uncharacterized membrane protein
MNRTDDPRYLEAKARERKLMVHKVLSYVYSMLDTVVGFFVVWTFFSVLRIVVGMSTEIFWLSKALIQQVSFIVVALIMCVAVIIGQWLFERSMDKNDTYMPKSFIVMTAALLVIYGVLKLIVLYY